MHLWEVEGCKGAYDAHNVRNIQDHICYIISVIIVLIIGKRDRCLQRFHIFNYANESMNIT